MRVVALARSILLTMLACEATKAEVLRAYPTAKYDPFDAGREVALVELGPDEGLYFILEDGDGRVVSIELGDLRPCAQCE